MTDGLPLHPWHPSTPSGRTAVPPPAPSRRPGLVRAALGTAVLAAAPRIVRAVQGGRPVPAEAALIARVLGARELAQGLVTASDPAPAVLRGGTAVDLLHLATMALAVRRGGSYRRLAVAAAAGALLDLVADRAATSPPPASPRAGRAG